MFEEILKQLQEAAKVLHLDDSLSALHSKLQSHVATAHRAANAGDGSQSYYDYPYVADIYGDQESGTLVTSHKGSLAMHGYKGKGDAYTISEGKPVKRAYVAVTANKEAATFDEFIIDGQSLAAKDPLQESEFATDPIEFREAVLDANGKGQVKLIAPGQGSTAFYSADVLKQAATDKVFPKGTQMFLDHQTEAENAARPEGSVKNLGAVLTSDAKWEDAHTEGPGLYANIEALPHTKDFINSIGRVAGVSIRSMGHSVMGTVGGKVTPIAKKLVYSRSVDFVTKAGAGGKLVAMLESFRQKQPTAATKEKEMAVTLTDEQYAGFTESMKLVPTMQITLQRQAEQLARFNARDVAMSYLQESGLNLHANKRVLDTVTAATFTVPMTEAGILDIEKFKVTLKSLVESEAAYLKANGVTLTVRNMGDGGTPAPESDVNLQESAKKATDEFALLTGKLSGVKKSA
jgi:hypothetical protein